MWPSSNVDRQKRQPGPANDKCRALQEPAERDKRLGLAESDTGQNGCGRE
jgi:hypothetical protein